MFKGNPFKVKNIPNFSMGLNDQMDATEILDNELSDCENWTVDEATIMTAPGYIRWDNSPSEGPFWGIYQFKKSDGTQVLLRQRKDVLEYDSDDLGTWATCDLPTEGSPAAPISLVQAQPTFATLNDICIYCDGTRVLSSTDGVTWTIPTTGSPAATLPAGLVFNNGKNRIFYVVKETSEIWWSDINDPLTIGATSWEFIDPNSGSKIVGMALSPDGSVLCFKDNGIYALDDVGSGMVGVNFIGKASCASHHSICTTEDSVFFLGYDGGYEFIGGTIRPVSGRIKVTGRNAFTRSDLTCAKYIGGKIYFSCPDIDVDSSYNSQEYVIHKKLTRQDPVQPYVITRNRRYFGCYGVESYEDGGSTYKTLYAGGSTTFTEGSPAQTISEFCFVNYFRDENITQGLNGEPQTGYFVTKFFTENIPYYVKKYKKLFLELNVNEATILNVCYRFSPYGAWTDIGRMYDTEEIDLVLPDGSSVEFDEGFGFAVAKIINDFFDIENTEKPRGIQFKLISNSITNITDLSMAYSYKVKQKFK